MRGVNNKTNGDGEGEQGNQRERLEEGGEIGEKEQGDGDRWQGKIIFIIIFKLIFFFIKKKSTNQIAGYFTLLPGLLNFWADFLFWKFSL